MKTDALVGLGQAFFKKGMFDLARRQLEARPRVDPRRKPAEQRDPLQPWARRREGGAPKDALGFYLRIYEVDVAYRDISDKVKKLQSAG